MSCELRNRDTSAHAPTATAAVFTPCALVAAGRDRFGDCRRARPWRRADRRSCTAGSACRTRGCFFGRRARHRAWRSEPCRHLEHRLAGSLGAHNRDPAVLPMAGLAAWRIIDVVTLPPINDISTDIVSPPAFLTDGPARRARGVEGPGPYPRAFAPLQRLYYPDVQPIIADAPIEEIYPLVLQRRRSLGSISSTRRRPEATRR